MIEHTATTPARRPATSACLDLRAAYASRSPERPFKIVSILFLKILNKTHQCDADAHLDLVSKSERTGEGMTAYMYGQHAHSPLGELETKRC